MAPWRRLRPHEHRACNAPFSPVTGEALTYGPGIKHRAVNFNAGLGFGMKLVIWEHGKGLLRET